MHNDNYISFNNKNLTNKDETEEGLYKTSTTENILASDSNHLEIKNQNVEAATNPQSDDSYIHGEELVKNDLKSTDVTYTNKLLKVGNINQTTSLEDELYTFKNLISGAYVTYIKSDDALRAIQSVNNITIDGRVIKSSLGTTKYCSHFMKNQTCPKSDCMYLHEYGKWL